MSSEDRNVIYQWVEIIEPRCKEIMYVNLATGDCQWEPPNNVFVKKMDRNQWWELFDNKTNRFYYFNAQTQKTVWNKPENADIIPLAKLQSQPSTALQRRQSNTRESSRRRGTGDRRLGGASPGPDSSRSATPCASTAVQTDDELVEGGGGGKKEASGGILKVSTDTSKHTPVTNGHPNRGTLESTLRCLEEHCTVSETSVDSGLPDNSSWDSLDGEHVHANHQPGSYQPLTGSGPWASFTHGSGTPQSRPRAFPRTNPAFRRPSDPRPVPCAVGAYRNFYSSHRGLQRPAYLSSRAALVATPTSTHSPSSEAADSPNSILRSTPISGDTPGCNSGTSAGSTPRNGSATFSPTMSASVMQPPVYDQPPLPLPEGGGMRPVEALSSTVASFGVCDIMRPKSAMMHAMHQGSQEEPVTMLARSSPSPVGFLEIGGSVQLPRRQLPQAGTPNNNSSPPNLPVGWNMGLFRREQTPAKLLNWAKDSLTKPLLQATDKSLKKEACETFKQIQMYMGDRKCKHSAGELLQSLIQRGWSIPALRDEVYMQLCKQTSNNPDELSTCRGWELICTCLSFFPPTPLFRPYLEGYLVRHLQSSMRGENPLPLLVVQYAQVAVRRVRSGGGQALARKYSQPVTLTEVEQVKLSRSSSFSTRWRSSTRSLLVPSMFGTTLEEIMAMQAERYPDRRLPWLLVTLAEEILRNNGAQTLGIFRLPGDQETTFRLRTSCEQYDLPSPIDPLPGATLLKLWLKELGHPLIPDSFVRSAAVLAGEPQEAANLIGRLPLLHRLCLVYLIRFLQVLAVEENSTVSQMDVDALAQALSPAIFQWRATGSQQNLASPESVRGNCVTFVRTLILHLDTTEIEGLR